MFFCIEDNACHLPDVVIIPLSIIRSKEQTLDKMQQILEKIYLFYRKSKRQRVALKQQDELEIK